MNVLMLGWEFPPMIAGGLGVACRGLTQGLTQAGAQVLFLLPRATAALPPGQVRVVSSQQDVPPGPLADPTPPSVAQPSVRFIPIPATLKPYDRPPQPAATQTPASPRTKCHVSTVPQELQALLGRIRSGDADSLYGPDLFGQVQRFALLACRAALAETFDVIHAHDWMTYQAGVSLAILTQKPLVLHVHSTEFDRNGSQADPRIVDLERYAMQRADAVVTVSHLTRQQILRRYDLPPERVHVVYNAPSEPAPTPKPRPSTGPRSEKIVLFLGRVTRQKGLEFFLAAAEKVLQERQNVRFILAGAGDGVESAVASAAQRGIAHRVHFTGFLRGPEVDRVFALADLFVMPSRSEPFGLAALEAAQHNLPIILTHQSGAAEVLTHALKVDHGHVDALAAGILRILSDPTLAERLRQGALSDIRRLTWQASAKQCLAIYQQLTTP